MECKKERKRMGKKGQSEIIPDVFSAFVIVVIIGIFFFSFSAISGNVSVKVQGEQYNSEADEFMVLYLNTFIQDPKTNESIKIYQALDAAHLDKDSQYAQDLTYAVTQETMRIFGALAREQEQTWIVQITDVETEENIFVYDAALGDATPGQEKKAEKRLKKAISFAEIKLPSKQVGQFYNIKMGLRCGTKKYCLSI
jgi:hypothetical protein